MLISIVIPAFNEAKIIAQTLKRIQFAIKEHNINAVSWEIIVCDNNSTDQTAELAARAGATVIFEPSNQIAKARNKGASIAKGTWLLFIDADTYPSPELITDVLEVINAGDFIGCGTTIEVVGGTLFNKLRMERLNPLFRLLKFSGGAFLLCQKEAFNEISGFSTNLYAYEEIDFVFRLKKYARRQGKKFTVLHHHPVITSGRKGEYRISSLAILFSSNIAGIALLLLHYFLPEALVKKLGSRLLSYWYNDRK